MNSQLRTADPGGVLATSAIHRVRRISFPLSFPHTQPSPLRGKGIAKWWMMAALLPALVSLFVGCGVQAPPRPPRVEIPQQIKDLNATQVGRTLKVTFTLPVLAVDGELLTKPVNINIYRSVSPPGQKPAAPDTSATAWLSLSSRELPRYTHNGKVDYPDQVSPQDFRRQQDSAFSFVVVAFTRGFRGHPRRSAPSNLARVTLLNVTKPVTDFAVRTTQKALLLTWNKPVETLTGQPPSHLSGYRVYQSATGKPESYHLIGHTASTHFDDTNFQFGRQYYFRVTALTTLAGTVAQSDPSAPVAVTPRDIFPPPVPTGLTAVNAAGAVDLLWNASSASDLAGYNVYRSTDGGPFERINKQQVPTPIYHDASVAPRHHYQYAVTAVDLSGNESARSKPAGITTPSPAAP